MNNDLYGSRLGQSLPSSAKLQERDLLSAWWRFELIGCRCLAIIATVLIVWSGIVSAAPALLPTVAVAEQVLKAPAVTSLVTAMLTAEDRPAQLGQPLTNFVKAYGQPDENDKFRQKTLSVITASGWLIHPISKDDSLVVNVFDENTGGKGWATIGEAAKACEAYMPKDSKFKKTVTIPADTKEGVPPATIHVYTSSSLASLFDASAFVDGDGKDLPSGTFSISYYGDNANNQHIRTCNLSLAVYGSGSRHLN